MSTKLSKQRLEITYDYHPNSNHRREHWMYVEVSGSTVEECYDKGRKYFQKQISELGWTKITTLTNIGPLRKFNDAPSKKPVSADAVSVDDTKSGNTQRRKRTSSGDRRKTRTSKRRVKGS